MSFSLIVYKHIQFTDQTPADIAGVYTFYFFLWQTVSSNTCWIHAQKVPIRAEVTDSKLHWHYLLLSAKWVHFIPNIQILVAKPIFLLYQLAWNDIPPPYFFLRNRFSAMFGSPSWCSYDLQWNESVSFFSFPSLCYSKVLKHSQLFPVIFPQKHLPRVTEGHLSKAQLCSWQRFRQGKLHGLFHLECFISDIWGKEVIINKSKDYFWNCLLIIDTEGLIFFSYHCLSTAIIIINVKQDVFVTEGTCVYYNMVGWLNCSYMQNCH